MARIEKRSVTCKPIDENDTIAKYEKFGWTLDSSQEVFNKDSHVEGRGNVNYSVTETVNYVKLVFSRDKDMNYYERITMLEQQYDSITEQYPSKVGSVFATVFGWVFTGLGLLFLMISCAAKSAEMIPSVIIFLPIGIGLLVLSFILKSRYNDKYTAVKEDCERKRREILKEVAQYI